MHELFPENFSNNIMEKGGEALGVYELLDDSSVVTRVTPYPNKDIASSMIHNYKIMEDAVMNVSAAPQLRVITLLGLTYSTSPEMMKKALAILRNIAEENDAISDEGISAVFNSFGDFSLNIRYCYFVKDASDVFDTPSVVNFEILKRFNEAGIAFAFPTQTLQIEKTVVNLAE